MRFVSMFNPSFLFFPFFLHEMSLSHTAVRLEQCVQDADAVSYASLRPDYYTSPYCRQSRNKGFNPNTSITAIHYTIRENYRLGSDYDYSASNAFLSAVHLRASSQAHSSQGGDLCMVMQASCSPSFELAATILFFHQ
ncbi:hypothetical protein B0T10DRAFT_492439 [Thelonectria olida]|uniref:Uncharacterized protein n=1 Tax=Thelonectria olida TaxID=1576542 RepID=A0A9P8W2D5_9HYPO|nr:hypothetical protein B0T10DRAFT_492439 [Thelonectria olida]